MGRTAPVLDRVRLQAALVAFLDGTMPACADVEYRLVGTGAALLHGVSLPASDIDILVRERRSVDAFASALSSFTCLEAPALLAGARQYYGNYEVRGVEVGISTVEAASDADTFETIGSGPWKHFAKLACGPYWVPTVALELRLVTELYRNRPDRHEPIIRHMQREGCDLDLVRRGIANAGLPPDVQEDLIRRLGSTASGIGTS